MTAPLVELVDISKDYGGLRPLRVERLGVDAGERIAVIGWDLLAAEVFVNLVTGATLPDRGDVRVFGRSTATIGDSAEWLALADRFGIVSERAVLLDAFTVEQNLAVPFTLQIEPPPDDVRARAAQLGREVGLPDSVLTRAAGELDVALRLRIRLGRALALDPEVLLLEHPTAGVPRPDVASLARDARAVGERRRAALLAITGDEEFARGLGARILTIDAATGRLGEPRRRWFR